MHVDQWMIDALTFRILQYYVVESWVSAHGRSTITPYFSLPQVLTAYPVYWALTLIVSQATIIKVLLGGVWLGGVVNFTISKK